MLGGFFGFVFVFLRSVLLMNSGVAGGAPAAGGLPEWRGCLRCKRSPAVAQVLTCPRRPLSAMAFAPASTPITNHLVARTARCRAASPRVTRKASSRSWPKIWLLLCILGAAQSRYNAARNPSHRKRRSARRAGTTLQFGSHFQNT